jgi:hypothetical protein
VFWPFMVSIEHTHTNINQRKMLDERGDFLLSVGISSHFPPLKGPAAGGKRKMPTMKGKLCRRWRRRHCCWCRRRIFAYQSRRQSLSLLLYHSLLNEDKQTKDEKKNLKRIKDFPFFFYTPLGRIRKFLRCSMSHK